MAAPAPSSAAASPRYGNRNPKPCRTGGTGDGSTVREQRPWGAPVRGGDPLPSPLVLSAGEPTPEQACAMVAPGYRALVVDSTPNQPPRGGPVKRPLLYWPGGKWRLGKWIASWFPAHDVYVEPFGGAASVLLQKEPCRSEVYNDLDREMVNFIRVLRSDAMLDDLSWGLRLTKYMREGFEEAYRSQRFPNLIEDSRRLVVRSLMGEGNSGAMRPKKAGFRPETHARWAHWCKHPDHLRGIAARLRGVEIENGQAIPLMLRHDGPDTLFYVDPPYLRETRRDDRYYLHEMTAQQHVELLRALRKLDGMVVLSGYPSALYDGLVTGWSQREKTTHTYGGRERVECVWLNPACARRLAARGSPKSAT